MTSAETQRVRIDLAYDGRSFHGFARQRDPAVRTVQDVLEGALGRALGHDVHTVAAGRTDAGVHALAQVVHLDVDGHTPRARRWLTDLPAARRRLDRAVGDDVTIWRVTAVASDFDARFDATERRYRYLLETATAVDPLQRHVRWHVGGPLAVGAMRRAARHLIGEHDLASFCRRAPGRTTVRRVNGITISRDVTVVVVRLRGPAFCHQQVRSIVGCLVEVGRGRRSSDWLLAVREARDRRRAGPVAPPHGLVLDGVSYGRGVPAAPPARAGVG